MLYCMVCDKPQPAHPYSCFPGEKPVWNCAAQTGSQSVSGLAVCLAAGIDGIRNKIEPPEEVPENVYELKEEEKASRGIESLPADLHAAICELQKDAFIKEVLGEHISSKLIEAKEAEWMQYRTQVTGWEIEEYLYKI